MSPRDEDEHILPTAALYAEAIPGECCACEANIVRREELELKQREIETSSSKPSVIAARRSCRRTT